MDYFVTVKDKCPIPRTHPLLLSLTEAFKESSKSPDLTYVSEDDPRVLKNPYYTSAKDFPPMDAHLSGQNGESLLSGSLVFNGITHITHNAIISSKVPNVCAQRCPRQFGSGE